ncbi:hypothetical protein NL526_28925, partial [Klebsiella pneumoniae]|nr:hypothetical protein [Klebsiella pneumoniae]
QLISPESSVLLAVSGGADSVALFHLILQLQSRLGLKKIGIAHVNHCLRGAESDRDEQFVMELSRTHKVPYFQKRLSGKSMEDAG